MADRPKGFGMTAELQYKKLSKFDTEAALEVKQWMEEVIEMDMQMSGDGPDDFYSALKDGIFLCKLAERITGKSIKVNTSKMAFKQMENIGYFLTACESYGVVKTDLFQTVDLYEAQNMMQVINGINALGRKAQSKGFDGPRLGPKEADENKREFTQEQLDAGRQVIGLQSAGQMGANTSNSYGVRRQLRP